MKKILIVEDDHTIAELYRTKLKLHNYDVGIADNGLVALKNIKQSTPDLILLDLRMPILDGEKFLEKLRRQAKYSEIPVIILTNLSREEAPKTLWHYGISGYFVKAHNTPKELLDIVNEQLGLQN